MKRGVIREPVLGRDPEDIARPLHERQGIPVREHHAFGIAGRARCVEDVGQVALERAQLGCAIALRRDLGPRHVRHPCVARRVAARGRAGRRPLFREPHRTHRGAGRERLIERGGPLRNGHEPRDRAVARDVGQPRRGRPGIDRHVSCARLHHAVERDHALDRARQPQRNPVAGPHAVPGERAREAVREALELGVRERAAVHHKGRPAREARRRLGDEMGEERAHSPRQLAMILRCISELPE